MTDQSILHVDYKEASSYKNETFTTFYCKFVSKTN